MSLIRKGKDRPVLPILPDKKKTPESLIKAKHLREQLIKSDEKYLAMMKSLSENKVQLRILAEKIDKLIESDKGVHEKMKDDTDKAIEKVEKSEDVKEELIDKIKTAEDEK